MNSLLSSRLYDNRNFYKAFEKDLKKARKNILIESPFITTRRMNDLLPIFRKLRRRGVSIVINTRSPDEHDYEYALQATYAVQAMQEMDILVLYTGKLHRKLAIIDNKVLWEGSLNILSQNDSCEIMRRIGSEVLAWQMMEFAGIDKFVVLDGYCD
jgi:hypothetical protein